MVSSKLKKFRISAEHWGVVLTEAQAKQGISATQDEASIWARIYRTIISHKETLDTLLADYHQGGYNKCPYHTIEFPIELVDAVNILLPK